MTNLQALIIGIIQGLTEFLPVSSSGHIAIANRLLNIPNPDLSFAVAVHLATVLAVVVAFWRDIWAIVGGFFGGLGDLLWRRTSAARLWQHNTGFRSALLILVGSIPAGVAGFLLRDFVEGLFASLIAVGAMLIVTGLVLILADGVRARGVPLRQFRMGEAFLVGLAQAVAIVPGLSRSGSTIAAGRLFGLTRDDAARFSFLLSLPVILGAALADGANLLGVAGTAAGQPLLIGMAAAAIVGYLSIILVMKAVRAGRLRIFAHYCWLAGAAVIVWQLLAR